MDTYETYIKMCGKAVEIQEQWIPKTGDYIVHRDYGRYDENRKVMLISGTNSANHIYICGGEPFTYFTKDKLYLVPRQDQLQEILEYPVGSFNDNMWTALSCLSNYAFNTSNFRDFIPMSMEQFWLAFMMKEKFGKVWDGSNWIEIK